MNYLHNTTPLLETVTRYIKPEMSILISGYRFSYLPFPLFVNSEFTGVVTTLSKDDQYYIETCVDEGMRIQSTEKSKFVYPIQDPSDFVMVSNTSEERNNIKEQFFELKSILKPGGFMFLISSHNEYESLSKIVRETNFERIEVFRNAFECFFLVKKGWEQQDLLAFSGIYNS